MFRYIIKIIEKDQVIAETMKGLMHELFPKTEIELHESMCSDFSTCERGVVNVYMVSLDEFEKSDCGVKCIFDNIIIFYEDPAKKEEFEKKIQDYRKHYYFVQKPFHINSILKMGEGALMKLENLKEFGDYRINKKYKEIASIRENKIINITDKEMEILEYLIKDNFRPKSKEELLENVWGYSANIETHTLETYIYRLRMKIEQDSSNPQVIKTSEDNKYYADIK
ncbi:MAG: winged helix-turn-helix domain-containing protein [Alphaproteobacteria bacterium]|jgi:two-component SAPR family response regulator|nr:winged helix-turn-helix domain-containing protein [Alphaproteobacteria bacterium]